MCLVEREDAHGRPSVEQAARPASFISVFTANDVRREHVAQREAQPKVQSAK
jgi:orotate phosphoribosyltransferase